MKPITIEFNVKSGDQDFKEESVSLQSPEELFQYVAPGSPEHPNTENPIADIHATLELGMVFITGPLAEIAETAEEIMDKAGRGELSEAFLTVIGARG
jgi:hypothetical protein